MSHSHGWWRCTWVDEHGTTTETWFEGPWLATTSAWVVTPRQAVGYFAGTENH